MRLRVDLHAHPFEALGVSRPDAITAEHVVQIVEAARANGLNSLAVTEHSGLHWGLRAKELVNELGLDFTILPGEEAWAYPVEVVRIVLPSGRIFRCLAHPGAPADFRGVLPGLAPYLHAIELRNAVHDWHLDQRTIRAVAAEYGLLLLENSDAHEIHRVGCYANDVTMDLLEERATRGLVGLAESRPHLSDTPVKTSVAVAVAEYEPVALWPTPPMSSGSHR